MHTEKEQNTFHRREEEKHVIREKLRNFSQAMEGQILTNQM